MVEAIDFQTLMLMAVLCFGFGLIKHALSRIATALEKISSRGQP